MKLIRTIGIYLFFLLLLSKESSIFSQTGTDSIQLQPVLITSNRTEIFSVGYRLQKIDSASFAAQSQGNLADVLTRETGSVIKTNAPGMLATISLRGTGAEHTSILWNGVPLNSFLIGLTDLSLVPASLFSDVSLRYGGSSPLFGNSGLGGSIQLHSWLPKIPGFHSGIYLSGASWSDYRISLRNGFATKKLQASISGFLNSSANDFPYRFTGSIERMQNANIFQLGFMPSLAFQFSKNSRFEVSGWVQSSERELPNPVFSLPGVAIQNDSSVRIVASVEHRIKLTTIKFKIAGIDERLRYRDSNLLIDSRTHSKTLYSEVESRSLLGKYLMLQTGGFLANAYVNAPEFLQKRQEIRGGIYAAVRFLGMKNLDVNLLLRKDFSSGTQPPVVPALGCEYRFLKGKISIHGNVNRSYSLPTMNMKYWQPGGNPGLKPEKAWGGEYGLSVKQETRKVKINFGSAFFAQMVNDWILWRPISSTIWSPGNVKQVFARGIENHANVQLSKTKWNMIISMNQGFTFSTNRSVYESAQEFILGKQLPYVPMHFGNVSLAANWKKWNLRLWETWTGKRFTTSDNLLYLNGNAITDLSVSRDFYLPNFRFGVEGRINNLLNQNRELFPGRPLPGRSFFIRINIEFTSKNI